MLIARCQYRRFLNEESEQKPSFVIVSRFELCALIVSESVLLFRMLSQEEIEKCREAFERFDKDGSGTIDAWELKETLKVASC
jgi:hypothetical protein